jgi:hypothetical protein
MTGSLPNGLSLYPPEPTAVKAAGPWKDSRDMSETRDIQLNSLQTWGNCLKNPRTAITI